MGLFFRQGLRRAGPQRIGSVTSGLVGARPQAAAVIRQRLLSGSLLIALVNVSLDVVAATQQAAV
jgi:hypothetical protein